MSFLKKSPLVLVLSIILAGVAHADTCSSAIADLGSALTSASALDAEAAFYGVNVAIDLGVKDAGAKLFAAYVTSDEYALNQAALSGAVGKVQSACGAKGTTCMVAAFRIMNETGTARNAYTMAIAENSIAKATKSRSLINASERNLQTGEDEYRRQLKGLSDSAQAVCN